MPSLGRDATLQVNLQKRRSEIKCRPLAEMQPCKLIYKNDNLSKFRVKHYKSINATLLTSHLFSNIRWF
jgi:hypothetical protein